jgi:hypothetical protein
MKILISFVTLFFLSNVKAFVPSEAYTFDFNIKFHDMNSEREEKIFESVELLRRIFASLEFKTRILNHRFNGKKAFAWNKGLSNQEIYQRILGGVEKLEPERNNAMDVEIDLFTDMNSNVLGYTKTQTKKIWMNTKYFNAETTKVELSSHLMHEWLHKLGFGHERKRCQDRVYTVPYAIGYIVRDLAKEMIALDEQMEKELSLPQDVSPNMVNHWQSDNIKNRLLLR